MARSAPKKEVRRPPSSESSEPEDEDVQDFQDAEDDVEMASADEHEEQEPASDDASDSDAPKIPVIPVALKPKKEKAPRKRKDSPASDEEAPKRKRRARTAKDPGAPKKPNSAYTLFVKENHPAVKKRMAEKMGEEKGRLQTEIMKELGRMWGALSAEEKKVSRAKRRPELARGGSPAGDKHCANSRSAFFS